MAARPSTSRRQATPHAVRLKDVPEPMLDRAARGLGVEARGLAAKVSSIAAAHADRDQVVKRVAQLPPLCWLVLEILADAGGTLPEDELAAMARERAGVAPRALAACVESLQLPLFVARRVAQTAFGHKRSAIALVDTVAGTLTSLVRGLTLPVEPPTKAPPASSRADEREILALATLTAHRPVRVNRDGTPNRSSVKTLVKNLVIDLGRAYGHLVRASAHGLVAERLDAYVPVVPALRAAAQRGLYDNEAEAALEAWLPESDWVALEQFVRARWRSELDGRARAGGFGWVGTTAYYRRELGAISARGLDVVEHGGHTWVRRSSETLPLHGDGHVTPNLEVFLGPGAHPSLVVTIGLGAELIRVDHVLTFRLSPASVREGLGAGLAAKELIDALERVGPHGLADNVRQSVLDFARQARIAELRSAVVLKLPADSADAFCAKYAQRRLERVTPEVVLVPPDWEPKDLERCLRGLGVYTRALDSSPDARSTPESSAPLGFADDLEPFARLRPQPELVRRFFDDRRDEPKTSQPSATGLGKMQPSAMDARALSALIGSEMNGTPDAVRRLVLGSERLAAQADAELETWSAQLPPKQRLEVRGARSVPVVLLPYLTLLPEWRAEAMDGAQSLGDLVEASIRLVKPARCSAEGLSLLRDATHPQTIAATRAALERAVQHTGPVDMAGLEDESVDFETIEAEESDEYEFEDPIELPSAGSFPSLDAKRVSQALERAIVDGDAVFIKLRGPGRARVQALMPEVVRTRAGQKVLLATDLETDDARVVDVLEIESILPFD